MERRGRIPVATYRTPEGKTRSRSRVRDPNYNKSDPETDLFTLLEDNIALREENDTLQQKNNKFEEEKQKLEKENAGLKTRIKELEGQHEMLRSQMVEINLTLNKTIEEKMLIKSSQQQSNDKIKKLSKQIEELKSFQSQSQFDNKEIKAINQLLQDEISKLVPSANTNEFESLVDIQKDTSCMFAIDCLQKLIAEFTQTKTNLSNVELHLYEANEKISELLENQTHLEEEIEQLRTENTNLTRVAELMTTNMRESVTTSKKMEEALIEMKRRNDELTKHTSDSLDGGGGGIGSDPTRKITTATITPINNASPTIANQEITRLREEINRRELAHGERIVEMKRLMDAAIENTSNEEIRTLRLKVEMLEKDLSMAMERAERAEAKLTEYEQNIHASLPNLTGRSRGNGLGGGECYQSSSSLHSGTTLISSISFTTASPTTTSTSTGADPSAPAPAAPLAPPPPPPPPPPPMPKLNFPASSLKNTKGARSLNDSIATHSLKSENGEGNGGGSMKRKQQVESTGLDALVKELKDGNVTLRRARRRTQTNAALKELFDVLEQSRKQNRDSKIFIENHMTEINLNNQQNF